MPKQEIPHLTIVGDQPRRKTGKAEMEVPVGLEKLLYLAAGDEALKADLLEDRARTIERLGIRLRESESTLLNTISNTQLSAMIDRIRPDNPKRRKSMGVVAAAATSLAAGTAVISCDGLGKTKGCDADDSGVEPAPVSDPDAGADGGK